MIRKSTYPGYRRDKIHNERKMIPMNMFKSNGGFTLVELIIVIAILAILAGVAVPAYSGYLKSAEKAADIPNLDAIKTACQAALAETGDTVTSITIAAEGGVISSVTANTTLLYSTDANATVADTDFSDYVKVNEITLGYEDYLDGTAWSAADGWAE